MNIQGSGLSLLDPLLVALQLRARPVALDEDLVFDLALLVIIIALINLYFPGLNAENADLVALLDQEASFVRLGKEEDEVGVLRERE